MYLAMNAKDLYLKGTEAFSSCDYEGALGFFLPILDFNNEDENLLLRISQCYQELARYNEAIDFLEKLLNINMKKSNLRRAIAVCKRILSIDPDDTEVILKLAHIFRSLRQYGEASNYYKIVARHYEYAGFMDKAIEVLQIIKDMGYEGIEDVLEMVRREYKRGERDKVNKSIESIICELKKGGENRLLESALNLALSNFAENYDYALELAQIYFKTGRLYRSLHMCVWALRVNPESLHVLELAIKILFSLGNQNLASRLSNAVQQDWPGLNVDDKSSLEDIKKITQIILKYDKTKLKVHEKLVNSQTLGVSDSVVLDYLSSRDFEGIDNEKIEHEILIQEMEQKINESAEDKTLIVDTKKQYRMNPDVFEILREAEILMSEGLYEKASQKILDLLEKDPGNRQGRLLLDKVLKLSGGVSTVDVLSGIKVVDKTTDDMIKDLDSYLTNKDSVNSDSSRYTTGSTPCSVITQCLFLSSSNSKNNILPLLN